MKKLLALVLALVMTLSLCVTSNAAFAGEEYDYDEAVEVMAAVGVFQGDQNGKFNGKQQLTREAAAKLIAYLDLGEKVAEALPAVKVFSDVEASRWSAKYIAYCADAGYIAGVGDGSFNPTGSLTGYAFGKMLLCALGYDATVEGFTGSAWSIAVAKLMSTNDIAKGIDTALSATLTREQGAQYCLNTLKATCVDYTGGTDITIGDTKITQGATRVPVIGANSTTTYVVALDDTDATVNGVLGKTIQLGEKLYEGKLVYTETAQLDDFKRLSGSWFYDKDAKKDTDPATTAADSDNLVVKSALKTATYTVTLAKDYDSTKAAYDTIAEILQSVTGNDKLTYAYGYNTNYFYNGQAGDSTEADEIADNFDVGNIVEVWTTGNTVDRVVVSAYTLGKIKKVDTAVSAADAKLGVSAYVTVIDPYTLSTVDTFVDASDDSTDHVLGGFDAATYVKDAFIAYAIDGNDDIIDSYVVAPETGKITSYKDNDYVCLDGAKKLFAVGNVGAEDSFSFTASYDVYSTKEGYVLFVDGVSSASLDDVYYVTGAYKTTTKGVDSYFVETVSMTGEVADLQLESAEFSESAGAINGLDWSPAFETTVAGLYVLTDDATTVGTTACKANNGKFNAVAKGAASTYGSYTVKAAAGTLADDVTASSKYLTISGAKYYFNAETQFISVEGANSALEVKTASGLMKADATYAAAYVIEKTSDTTKTANYVIYVGTDLSASNVAVDTANTLYVKSASTQKTTVADTAAIVTDVRFMKDNSTDTVNVKASGSVARGFYTYEINADGLYELSAVTANSLDTEIDSKTDGYYANVGFGNTRLDTVDFKTAFDGVSYADATVVDLRSADDIKADADFDREIGSVAALNSAIDEIDANENLVADVYVTDGEITFIAVKGYKSTVATLASVEHDGGTITHVGNAYSATGTFSGYLVITANDTNATIVVTATPTNLSGESVDGVYTSPFTFTGYGGKTFTVVVTAEDGVTTETYTINPAV